MKGKEVGKKLLEMLKSNWPMKLLSLLLAFIIWSYVMVGTNPTRMKTVEGVPVTITNAAELRAKNLIIDESASAIPETVTVTVEAGIDSHKNITKDTIKATLNLADINSKGQIRLQLTGTLFGSGATVKNISPSEIVLTVDELVSKNVPVIAMLEGEARDDYYVGEPKLSSDYVLITGARSVVEKTVKAVCYIDVKDLTNSTKQSFPLTLYDANGEEVSADNVIENMPSAIVDIPVLPKKTVPIDEQSIIDAIINVKEGYEVTAVEFEPKSIQIAADSSVLKEIELVRVQSINVDGADKSIMMDVAVQPLENIKYQSASMVSVLVKISEIQEERTFRNRRIGLENLEEGLTAQIVKDKYTDVTVMGGKSVVGELVADDLMPYIDLAGLARGTHNCVVEIPQIDGVPVEGVKMSVTTVKVIIK